MRNIFRKQNSGRNYSAGFTLIELMVVVAIVSLLASVIVGLVSSSRAKAKDANIATEIHLIQLALEEYNTGHGGFPNPQGGDQSSDNMYCIGSTDCIYNGYLVSTQLKGTDIAFNKINSNLLASSFPVFTSEQIATLDNDNKGYIYVACGGSNPTCPNDQAILMYPKIQAGSFSVINVGTFNESSCEIAQCQENYGHNCGNGSQECSVFSNTEGSCNYDVNGSGGSSGTCTCGGNNSDCSMFCGDSSSNDGCSYDPNGTGSCSCNTLQYSESSYPYCSSDSNTGNYSYDSGNSGWCSGSGYSYYGSGTPSNYPYYNGTGSCISVNVSSSYGNGQSGSYCNMPYDPGYQESSYPWFTSDSTAGSYGYSSGNGWSGYGYYGTSYPSGYPYAGGSGSCIYISVSSSYGGGYYTNYYCNSQNIVYGCTDSGACNYDPNANSNSGCDYSCHDTTVYGCTDGSACNYNSSANSNDGSCEYMSCHTVYGCTSGSACNYNSSATNDDGSCEYTSCMTTYGCTDSTACNYNSSANYSDGSCDYSSCHSYSCQGTPSCGYGDSYSCQNYNNYSGSNCSWSSNGGSCSGTYYTSGDCSAFNNDYWACSNNGCNTNYDDNSNFYCSGMYNTGNDCSSLDSGSCGSYSGCSWNDYGGSCNVSRNCSDNTDSNSCGNTSGCTWTYS